MSRIVIAAVALAASLSASCSEGPGITAQVREPSPQPDATPDDARPRRNLSPPVRSIAGALALAREKVAVEVALPAGLPEGTRLRARRPMYLHRSDGEWAADLYLVWGGSGQLLIQFGAAGFDGCGGDSARTVTIGHHEGLVNPIDVEPESVYSSVIWPATRRDPRGLYGLHGTVTAEEIVRMAETMDLRVSDGGTGPTGC